MKFLNLNHIKLSETHSSSFRSTHVKTQELRSYIWPVTTRLNRTVLDTGPNSMALTVKARSLLLANAHYNALH